LLTFNVRHMALDVIIEKEKKILSIEHQITV